MNKKTVDIVIAAYNSHEYLPRALSSILFQKIDFPVKVIIVNDGSIEDYSYITNSFSSKLDIKEINLDKNYGVGVAKQRGLDNCTGDYVVFLDADDVFYDSFSLQNLYNLVALDDADYGYGALIIEEDNSRNTYKSHEGCLHGKIYKRDMIIKNNISFNSTRTSEDNSFNHLSLFCSKNINKTTDVVYVYKDNSKSLTRGISIEKVTDNLIDYIDNVYYTLSNVKDKYSDDVIRYYVQSLCYLFSEYNEVNSIDKKQGERVLNNINDLKEKADFYSSDYFKKFIPEIILDSLE